MIRLYFELFVIGLLILTNGFLAMAELAIVSSRKARLLDLSSRGNSRASAVLKTMEDSSSFLAAIQVGISLIAVLAGAFSGATIAKHLSTYLAETFPSIEAYSGAIGISVVVMGVTYLSLIIGELVPKRIALNNPENVAVFLIGPVNFLSRITKPVIWVLKVSTNWVLKLLRISHAVLPPVTEEEVKFMIEQGTQAGVFEKSEGSMLKNVLEFADYRAKELMTPRTQVVSIDINQGINEILKKIQGSKHSYFPAYDSGIDDLVGLLCTKTILDKLVQNGSEGLAIHECIDKEPLAIPQCMTASKILEKFKKSRKHVAIVIDEFGGMAGLLSMIDIVEAIVGDIPNSLVSSPPSIQKRNDGSWVLDGQIPIDEIKDLSGLDFFDVEEDEDVITIGGYFMKQLQRVPKKGDRIESKSYTLKVINMDGHRVDRIAIKKRRAKLDPVHLR